MTYRAKFRTAKPSMHLALVYLLRSISCTKVLALHELLILGLQDWECREGFRVDTANPHARVMATSRGERQIQEQLGPIADYSINIQSAMVDEDIRVYIRDRLATVSKLKKWPQPVQNEIITVIMKKAGGHLPSDQVPCGREAQYNDYYDDV